MKYERFVFAAFAIVVLARPALAQSNTDPISLGAGADVAGALVRVVSNAPIYVLPDANRLPIRVAKEGSVLRVVREQGNWVYVEFSDPDYERRFGYIETKLVQAVRAPLPEAVDLSVREARQPAPPTTQQPRPQPQPQPQPQPPVVRGPARQEDTVQEGLAQKSYSSKFFLGVGLEGNGVVTALPAGNVTDSGTGAGVVLGYGFNPTWSLYGEISAANIVPSAGGTTRSPMWISTRVCTF